MSCKSPVPYAIIKSAAYGENKLQPASDIIGHKGQNKYYRLLVLAVNRLSGADLPFFERFCCLDWSRGQVIY